MLLPESVNSQRQHGKLKGRNVLKSMATVTPLALALLEPYTFTPLCPLAVVVTCRLLDVIAPALFIPAVVDVPSTDSEPLNEAAPLAPSVVAATGPEIVEELLKVPVLATPVRFEGPEALSVVAATGPEIEPVEAMVPALVKDPLIVRLPTGERYIAGLPELSAVTAYGDELVLAV